MSTVLEVFAGFAVEVVIFGVAGGVLYRVWRGASFLPQRKTLMPFNRGVIMEDERVIKVLQKGSCWIKPRQSIIPVDMRPRPFQTRPRELLTADQQGIRVRFDGEYKVEDPALFVTANMDGHAAIYLAIEREIAVTMAELTKTELFEPGFSPANRVQERIEPRAAELGVAIRRLEVSDLIPITWIQQSAES